jgi:hypothetical protein
MSDYMPASDFVISHLTQTLQQTMVWTSQKRLFLTSKLNGILCWGYCVSGTESVRSVYDVLSE